MRTFGLVLGVLVTAASMAAAQSSVSQLVVIAPPTTNPELGPRTLTPSIVNCVDLPTIAAPSSELRIIASQSGDTHRVYPPGEIVVLNSGTPQGIAVGQRYFTRRLQLGFNGEPPSVKAQGAIRTSGWLTVVAADDRFALARIDYSCDTVAEGDFLAPYVEPALPAVPAAAGPPNFSDMARVLFGPDRRQTFGPGDVANIDRGTAKGIAVGTRVSFYRDRQLGTPLVEMGAGIVVEVAADSAKVVLTRARDAVWRGDYVVVH